MVASVQKDEKGKRPEDILDVLRRIAVQHLELTPEQIGRIQPTSRIAEVLELDSVAQVVFALEIEDHFGFSFEVEDMERLKTIEDLIRTVQMRCSKM